MKNDQLVMERAEQASPASRAPAAGIKTILLHVQNGAKLKERLDMAASLARANSAHLTCLHVTPIQAYVAMDSFGGVFVMKDVIRTIDEEETRLRQSVEADLRREDISWDYVQTTGNVATVITRYAALADLVVIGREPRRTDYAGATTGMIGDLLSDARTPLLILGDGPASFKPSGPALIAWDGSFEAANAVRACIGLLQTAESVRLLQVEEDKTASDFPGTAMLEFLSRHDIHAELVVDRAPGHRDADFVAASIMSQAQGMDAGYIVMGGYSHSRVGEYMFGGVTRTLLRGCPIAVAMAH